MKERPTDFGKTVKSVIYYGCRLGVVFPCDFHYQNDGGFH